MLVLLPISRKRSIVIAMQERKKSERERERTKKERKTRLGLHVGSDIYLVGPWERGSFSIFYLF